MLMFWTCVSKEKEEEGEITCPAALCAAYTWDLHHLNTMNWNKDPSCKWIVFSVASSFKGVLPVGVALKL